MARLALEQLTPGTRLEKPVLNAEGVLLLKAGETLTAKHIQILQGWGIRDVEVAGEQDAVPQPSPVSAEVLQAAGTEIARRFRRADRTDPVMAEIQRIATALLARRLASDPGYEPGRRA